MESIILIIKNKNWNAAAAGAILSCPDILKRVKTLKEIYGDDNVTCVSSTNYQHILKVLQEEFKKGKKLDSLSIPGFKNEPRNGNYRVTMVDEKNVIPMVRQGNMFVANL
jgi:hypothetical protein